MRGKAVLADVVIGPHGPFTTWVFSVISTLAAKLSERPVLHTDRFDDVHFLDDPRPIILTHYPSQQIIEAIEGGDMNVALVIEDPLDVTRYLQDLLQLPMIETIRAQTSSAVANSAIGRADRVLYLDRSTERTIERLVILIAQHLRFEVEPEDLRTAATEIAAPLQPDASLESILSARGDHYAPPLRSQALGQIDELMMAGLQVLDPLLAMAHGDTMRPVVWPTPIFKFGDQPDQPPPPMPEISGPPRNLYYGPYLYLPPGRYRVEAILAFSEEVRNVPFAIEVHAENWLVTALIDKRRGDSYRGYCLIDHRDPCATVEIRLRNERGVAHGRLSLIELLFFLQPDEPNAGGAH